MADLVITAASVQKTSSTKTKDGVAGAAIVAGQFITRDPVTRRMLLGDGDLVITDIKNSGIALNSAAIGQPVEFAWDGDVVVGAVLAVARVFILSSTPGGVAPVADLASGDFTTIIGLARTTSILSLCLHTAEVAIP